MEGEIAAKFLSEVLAQPQVKRLLSSEHFSVDRTLIQAWASMKSFRPKEPPDNDGGAGGRTLRPTSAVGHHRSEASTVGGACVI